MLEGRLLPGIKCQPAVDLVEIGLVLPDVRDFALARLPLYCSAECATPEHPQIANTSLFAIFSRNLANAPLPHESFRTCIVCATHARSHFSSLHWLLGFGFCAIWIWVCILCIISSRLETINSRILIQGFFRILKFRNAVSEITPLRYGQPGTGLGWLFQFLGNSFESPSSLS